jgi:threonine dehydrogenase-like Zn-dependent dehydrogenase
MVSGEWGTPILQDTHQPCVIPAPVRRFLPHLIDLVLQRKINPGKVFDLELPLADVAEGYRAMDERRAIKTLLRI